MTERDYSDDFNRSAENAYMKELRELFFSAAEQGNLSVLTKIVSKYPEAVAWRNPADENKTGLHIAIENQHRDCALFLIKEESDVHARTNRDSTPLMYSGWSGDTVVMKTLLRKGADVLDRNVDGVTALMPAAHNGHLEAVKMLIDEGADILAEDKQGVSAERFAQEGGHDDIVGLFQRYTAATAETTQTPAPANDHASHATTPDKVKDNPAIDSLVDRLKKAKLLK